MSQREVPSIPGTDVSEQKREVTELPREYAVSVLVHNDDVTPFDYVMHSLCSLFMLSTELADHIAWTAHTKGQSVVVVRPRMEATNLVRVANGRARDDGYPLTFTLDD